MRRNSRWILLVGALLASLSGCDCEGGGNVKKAQGDPRFKVTMPDQTVVLTDKLLVDFGPTLVNSRNERKIVLRNDGRGDIEINNIRRSDPFDDSFRFQFEPFGLGVGEEKELFVYFEPKTDGEKVSQILLDVADGTVTELLIDLKGLAVRGECIITPPETADFGSVALGTTYVMPIKVQNTSDLEWKLTVGCKPGDVGYPSCAITSNTDPNTFVFANFAPGEYTVPAHGEVMIPIEFRPNHLGAHTAFLAIPAPSMCQPSVLPLVGSGVESVLECEPRVLVRDPATGQSRYECVLDFGYVNPNSTAVAELSFNNIGNEPITVTGINLVQPVSKGDPFALPDGETGFTIPAREKVPVKVSFHPTLLGRQEGRLDFNSSDVKLPNGHFMLVGTGGGPDIQISPPRVDFGPVAIGTYQYRRITIANVGTDAAGTQEDNLKLVEKDATGAWVEKRAELSTSFPDEFILEWPPQGYIAQGIAAGQTADLRVRFTPTSPGPKTATVKIFSNDPDEPVVEVLVEAGGRTMPPCDYDVVPPQLNYGNLETGKSMILPFYIRNKASDASKECLVSTLGFARGTPDAYAIVGARVGAQTFPGGDLTGVTIPGGEQLEIQVRFAPKVAQSYPGYVEFYISSTTAPEGRVALLGNSQAGCLMIAPNDLDFGVIQSGCSSRAREFTVYNVCTTTQRLEKISIQDSLSTEFEITQAPVLPFNLGTGASVQFKATYKPVDVGEDKGSIEVLTTALSYVVTVAGRGATTAIQTDTFAQDPQPKVDVLFIIDNSCSMMNKQISLGNNFDAFIKFAVSQQVDYHIAATTTAIDMAHGNGDYDDGTEENGRFVPVSGANPRVITPSTPNKETVFKQNVAVGTNGNASEMLLRPGYLALSNPLLTQHNAGFLRDEAYLAVVVVSDAADQDTVPVSFYQNFYLNIKGFRRANRFSFSGIIPTQAIAPSGACDYDEYDAGQSPRTRDLVTRTGGVYDDICTPDWAKTLEKLGQTAFGYRTRFFLSNTPDMTLPDPIQVELDGLPYPAVGTAGDVRWTYNSTANAIDFEPLAVPEPGTTLTISYHVACL